MKKLLIVIEIIIAFVVIPLWIWVITPQLTKLPKNFSYKADVVSLDNLYDEATKQYSGEKRSVTKFSYEVTAVKDGILNIKNIFDVRKVTGEKIFAVERLYGIDPKTGKQVAGLGDKTRDGYLFAPRNLKYGQPFTYWHINYDGPAHMTFVRAENFLDLPVYHYETRYEGVRIDQTANLTNLPGVGVTRGIELEPYLQVWIEPVTGRMVKYEDDTVAYYYDLKTGERQSPWNNFSNTYTPESIIEQVGIVKQEIFNRFLIESVVPVIFAFLAVIIILVPYRKNRAIKILSLVVFAAVVLVGIGMWLVPKISPLLYTGSMEKIVVGDVGEYAVFDLIAKDKGYFKENGLDVEIKKYDSGPPAISDLLAGKVDIASAADFVGVRNMFDHKDLKVLSQMGKHEVFEVVGRKSHGVREQNDLKGKKIGITRKSASEFFLGRFLTLNNMQFKDVTIVDLAPTEIASQLEKGAIDVAVFNPYPSGVKQKLGADIVFWSAHGDQKTIALIYSTDGFIKVHPSSIERYVRSLIEAEKYYKEHEIETKELVASALHYDDTYINYIWSKFNFSLVLEQSLLLSLEDQAHFVIANKLTDETLVPNYTDFIYTDALRKVKLEAVTLY